MLPGPGRFVAATAVASSCRLGGTRLPQPKLWAAAAAVTGLRDIKGCRHASCLVGKRTGFSSPRTQAQPLPLAAIPAWGVAQAKGATRGFAQDSMSGEMKPRGDNVQFTWRSAVFTCGVAAACVAYYEYLLHETHSQSRAIVREDRIGVPKLGGPFELVDQTGKLRTDEDFKGQYLLIYFGFVFCPDICPVEMEKQTHAVELVDAEVGKDVTPIFISVDPRRDTPAAIAEYCKEFHPRIVGMTGTPEQVKKVSRAYRVYYNEGLKTDEQDYLIDHSIIHYFMGPDGKFIDFFGRNMTAREMADKMKEQILVDRDRKKQRKERRGVENVDD